MMINLLGTALLLWSLWRLLRWAARGLARILRTSHAAWSRQMQHARDRAAVSQLLRSP